MIIIVVTETKYNEKTKQKELLATHGINLDTGENVVLQNIHPEDLGAKFSEAYGEYIIE